MTDESNGTRPEEPPLFSILGYCSPILIGLLGAQAAVALWAPVNVLSAFVGPNCVVSLVNSVVPAGAEARRRWAYSTEWPEVALITISLSILATAVVAVWFFLRTTLHYRTFKFHQLAARQVIDKKWKYLFLTLVGVPASILAYVYGLVLVPGDSQLFAGLTSRSRPGLALVYTSTICLGLLAGGVPAMLRVVIDVHILGRRDLRV